MPLRRCRWCREAAYCSPECRHAATELSLPQVCEVCLDFGARLWLCLLLIGCCRDPPAAPQERPEARLCQASPKQLTHHCHGHMR